MPNACFSNPRHRNLDPKTNRKSNLEIDMKKSIFLVQKWSKSSQNGSPKSSKNRQNPSLDLTGSFLVPSNVPGSSQDRPRIVPGPRQDRPRIVPGSPRTPKERFQACHMIPMGTKIHQKSIKIMAWTSECCFVVCYGTHLEASGSYKVAPAEKPAPSAQREGPAAVGVAH